jgi:2,4-dienoyl-CoA reductase-like NADH-dependent reductase (Old Yellow Enzyme family)
MSNDISRLFEPVSVAGLHLRNRFVMAPMTRNFSPGGVPGDDVAAYYTRRAMAKVGLIITEGIGIDHQSALDAGTTGTAAIPSLHGDIALAGWRKVVESVHAAGGTIIPQLWHQGPIRQEGTPPYSDAPTMRPTDMSEGDIADVIGGFVRCAVNAMTVGFDGVALHGAHGYMLDAFLWKESNQRADKWGGDLIKRTRFVVETIKAVRAAVGPDFPILYRLSQWKLTDYGAVLAETPGELEQITRALAEAGVDLFDVSTRIFSTPAFEGSDMGLAGWVKKLSGKPVMTVGGIGLDKPLMESFSQPTAAINNLDEVMRRFDADEFDLVAVGRALLIDPAWVMKASIGAPFMPFSLAAYATLD